MAHPSIMMLEPNELRMPTNYKSSEVTCKYYNFNVSTCRCIQLMVVELIHIICALK